MRGDPSARYLERRTRLLASSAGGAARRRDLADLADAWLAALAGDTLGPGQALVAVGGLGRRELSPGSDLDLVLLHDGTAADDAAEAVWYPIWDAGVALDHAVRTPSETRALARDDVKVVLGLLDARCVAGDEDLVRATRSRVLADWRREAPRRLEDLDATVRDRHARHGDLAGTLEPDLKGGGGGLRDVAVLRALAAAGLTDYPHGPVGVATATLLDVRDQLHVATGRSHDRLSAQEQPNVAAGLGYGDADELLRGVIRAGRTISHASDATWRRARRVATPPRARLVRSGMRPGSRPRTRGRSFESPVDGVIVQAGEVALAPWADTHQDGGLVLRAATVAAARELPLVASTLERLTTAAAPPVPWAAATRRAFLDLLGAGPGLVAVWSELDEAGVVDRLLPEWQRVRHLPQRDPLHRFTVDRHQIETVVAAARRADTVARPDLLLVAALLHDIGKGSGRDHSATGAGVVAEVGPRLGFAGDDVATLVALVRHHLLLPATATRRDLDDPATVRAVTDVIDRHERLALLRALSHADAEATGPAAASAWRRDLVDRLVQRAAAALAGQRLRPVRPSSSSPPVVATTDISISDGATWQVTVAVPDAQPLLAAVAGTLASHRLTVHAATLGGQDGVAWLRCDAHLALGGAPATGEVVADLRRALAGELDLGARLARREEAYGPRPTGAAPAATRVTVLADASDRATVLEVAAGDRAGLLFDLAVALSDPDVRVHRALVSTLGTAATDVFYLTGSAGEPLADAVAERVVRAVRTVV